MAGEWQGDTATPAFEKALCRDYALRQRLPLPNWPSTSYALTIWARKGSAAASGAEGSLAPMPCADTFDTFPLYLPRLESDSAAALQCPSTRISRSHVLCALNVPPHESHGCCLCARCAQCGAVAVRRCRFCRAVAYCSAACAAAHAPSHRRTHELRGVLLPAARGEGLFECDSHYRPLRDFAQAQA